MENIAEGFKGERAIVTPYNIREYQSRNDITKLLYVTHIGYYPEAKHHYRKREQGANENILIYCDKGKGWIELDTTRVQLRQNTIYIIPANTPHAYGADRHDPWSILWLHFKGEKVDMFKTILGKLIYLHDTDSKNYKDRSLLFEEMFQNLEMGYNPENMEYVSFCLMYFLASVKYLPQYQEVKDLKIDNVIKKCIFFMKDNIENKISLDDIAQSVGFSVSHLSKLFSQKTSYSLIEYYNQLKIQRACTYLQFSDMKIKEIAYKLNYFDPFHFSKAFIKEMEIPPKEYRKRYWMKNKD